ncbi:MAG: DUF3102 domain-containing protein [Eubacteriales bacterium]|nr:DUF3102 domain-containing protein [Eubacteriales bacterium]
MNEITRNVETIANEILSIKETARTTLQTIATGAAVEIGKRLKEAKSLVPYGEWGMWLSSNVNYSERTAQNLMKLAEENARGGLEQMQELSYTQTLQLIGLPAGDRDAFLADNDVNELSTRELHVLVEEYKQKNAAQQLTIEEMERDLAQLNDKNGTADEISDARRDADAANAKAEDERRAREKAEAEKQAAEEKLQKARDDAAKAKKAAETAKKVRERLEDELTELRAKQTKMEEPQAPAEVPATVVEVVPEKVQKELDELREKELRMEAEAASAAAALKREESEYTFRLLYDQFRGQFEKLTATLEQMTPESRGRYTAALAGAMAKMSELLKEAE